jgi:tetratricopeptide (TPR) repeat protein
MSWQLWLCAAALAVAGVAAAADSEADLQRAKAAEASGNHQAAIDLFSQLLANEQVPASERRTALIGRGVARGNLGQFEAAVGDFTSAISLDPHLSDAYFDRALVESDIGSYRAALADLGAVASVADSYPGYYYYRGYVHFENDDFDEAIADLTTASQTMGKDANVYYRRAKAYDAKGQHELAMADFASTIALKPADESMLYASYRWRGTEAFALKRYEQAIADFSELLRLSPQDADASMRRAYAYFARGQWAAAANDAGKLIHDNAMIGALFPWPGVVDPSRCFPDRIVDKYNAGMRLPGLDPYARVMRARAYLKLGRKDEALADYAAAVHAIPPGADDSVSAEMASVRR